MRDSTPLPAGADDPRDVAASIVPSHHVDVRFSDMRAGGAGGGAGASPPDAVVQAGR